MIIASTMVQTYAGEAPLDLTLASSALAATGLVLLAASALLALRGLATRSRPPGRLSTRHGGSRRGLNAPTVATCRAGGAQ